MKKMANELVLIHETHVPIPFTVADGTGIEKGSLLKMASPMTASAITTKEDIIAGIAKTEKIANDGNTKLAVYRGGVFKVLISGSVTVGDALISVGAAEPNSVETAGVNAEDIVGIALATGTDGQTILMELGPRTNNLA